VTAPSANPTTTTLSVNTNPSTFGQQVLLTMKVAGNGVATNAGGLAITVDGDVFVTGGIFDLSVVDLTARGGTHTVFASYQGDGVRGNSASAPLAITVNPAASTITLSTSASSVPFGTPVTVGTEFTPTSPFAPRGSLTFFDGASPLAIIAANANQVFTTSSLPVGSHSITAAISGSPDLLPSTSAPITQVITPALAPDYTVSSSTNTQTVSAGQTAVFTITTQAINGFTGDVRFSCGNLPALTTCTFAPVQAVVGNGASSVTTLSVKTTGPHASLQPPGPPVPGAGQRVNALAWGGGLFVFAVVLLARASPGKRRRFAGLTLLLALALPVMSCGGGGSSQGGPSPTPTPPPATPSGTTTITVSAAAIATSGSKPANPNQQLQISLTVMQ
jgi:hypothetical protein